MSAAAYFVAAKIIELLSRGMDIEAIKPLVPQMTQSSLLLISATTLKYFVRNGRIGKAQGVVGNLMGVKPILTIEDGVVAPLTKERGIEKATRAMADIAFNFIANRRNNVKIYIEYGAEKNRNYMQMAFDAFMEKFKGLGIEDYEAVTGRGWPTVTCHSGPEVFSLSVYGETAPI